LLLQVTMKYFNNFDKFVLIRRVPNKTKSATIRYLAKNSFVDWSEWQDSLHTSTMRKQQRTQTMKSLVTCSIVFLSLDTNTCIAMKCNVSLLSVDVADINTLEAKNHEFLLLHAVYTYISCFLPFSPEPFVFSSAV
jgi:hypothetical protein